MNESESMDPEEACRRYRRSVARAAAIVTPVLGLAPVPMLIARFATTETSPPGWYMLGVISSVALVFIAMVAYILLRRCPACGCRSPVIKGSGDCCRRCGIRLVSPSNPLGLVVLFIALLLVAVFLRFSR